MHSVKLTVIADQEIEINGQAVNIHDLRSITLDGCGRIVDYSVKRDDETLHVRFTASEVAHDLTWPFVLFRRPVIETDDMIAREEEVKSEVGAVLAAELDAAMDKLFVQGDPFSRPVGFLSTE